ncbi:hypothetical protein HDV06_004472 [Boothiomyces sp. JEL0866]|nr:hypothetical protein HDV06_004472 [Boothiomyces sp. JEL0866]
MEALINKLSDLGDGQLIERLLKLLEIADNENIVYLLNEAASRPRGINNIVKAGGLHILQKYNKPEYQSLLEKVNAGIVFYHKETPVYIQSPIIETPVQRFAESPTKSHRQSPEKVIATEKIFLFNWKDLDEIQLEILNSFSELNNGFKENDQEIEYFDYLNTNVGSSVFLQYPKLFMQILDGLLSVHQYKYDQTLNYLSIMVESWTIESKITEPKAFLEIQMDVTVACSEIYFKLIKLLKKSDSRVLRLLYSLVPFLKLRKELDFHVRMFEAIVSVQVEEEWLKHQISSFGFNYLEECTRELESCDVEIVSVQVIEILLKFPHLHCYLLDLARLIQNDNFNLGIMMKSQNLKGSSLSNDLVSICLNTMNIRSLVSYCFSLPVSTGCSETDFAVGLKILNQFRMQESDIDILTYLQVFCPYDDLILEKTSEIIGQKDPEDQILYWIRGLLSRNNHYRAISCRKLEIFDIRAKPDIFQFDSSYLSSINRFAPVDGPFLTYEVKKTHVGDKGDRFCRRDGRIKENFVQDQLYSKLVSTIQIVLLNSFDIHLRFQTATLYSLSLFELKHDWKRIILGEDFNLEELCFPTAILDGFYMYGIASKAYKYKLPYFAASCKEILQQLSQLCKTIDTDQSMQYRSLELVSNLKLANSNKSFQGVLSSINNFAVESQYVNLIASNGIFEVFARFLMVHPNNEEDYNTLNSILLVLLNFQKFYAIKKLLNSSAKSLFGIVRAVNQTDFDTKIRVVINVCKLFANLFNSATENELIAYEKELSILQAINQLVNQIGKLPRLVCSDHVIPLSLINPFSKAVQCIANIPSNKVFDWIQTLVKITHEYLHAGKIDKISGYNTPAAGHLSLRILGNILACERISGISVNQDCLHMNGNINWIFDDLLTHQDGICRAWGYEILSNLVTESKWFGKQQILQIIQNAQETILDLNVKTLERKGCLKFYLKFYESRENYDVDVFKKLGDNQLILHANTILCSSNDFPFMCVFMKLLLSFAFSDIGVVKSKLGEIYFFEQIFKMELIYNSPWCEAKVDFLINLGRLVELLINYDHHFLRLLLEQCHLGGLLSYVITNTSSGGLILSAQRILSRSIYHLQRNNSEMLQTFFSFDHCGKYLFPLILQQLKSGNELYIQCARTLLAQILQLEIHYGFDLKIDLALVTPCDETCIGNVMTELLIQQYFVEQVYSSDLYNALELILHYISIFKSQSATSILPTRIEKEIEAMILYKIDPQKTSSLLDIAAVLCIDSDYSKVSFVRTSFLDILLLLLLDKSVDQKLHLKALYCITNLISDSLKNKRKLIQLHKQSPSKSLLTVLIKHCQSPSTKDSVFDECVEIFKILTIGVEFRTFIFKAAFVNSFYAIFRQLVKAKNYRRVSSILEFFKICCMENCGIFLAQIDDLFDSLASLMTIRQVSYSVLEILTHFATKKETKAYFLVNETFKDNCCKLLGSNSIKSVYMIVNLIWCLIYEYEKAKVDFKQYGIEAYNDMVARLDEYSFEVGIDSPEKYDFYLDATKQALKILDKLL